MEQSNLGFSFKGLFYRLFIDPMISGIRRRVAEMVEPGETVIDIACGTGALSLAMAGQARHVTGIDFSEEMILTARRMAQGRKTGTASFELRDATNLSCYPDNRFDLAVTSMAMHQFNPETGVKVLSEMNRIARRVIIADYNCPMMRGPGAALAWGIECAASGDHYRNFREYMRKGGMGKLTEEAKMIISGIEVFGNGVFTIVRGSSKSP